MPWTCCDSDMTLNSKSPWCERAATWFAGILTFKAFDYAFDYVLYPFAIYRLGLVVGGIVMAMLSLINCLLLLRLYDWLKRDWLGIEWLKGLKHYVGPANWRRVLAWLLGRGDVVAFFALSVRFDPFVTTAYLRRGQFDGLSRRACWIFFASVVVSNVSWALVCFGGVEVVRRLWAD